MRLRRRGEEFDLSLEGVAFVEIVEFLFCKETFRIAARVGSFNVVIYAISCLIQEFEDRHYLKYRSKRVRWPFSLKPDFQDA